MVTSSLSIMTSRVPWETVRRATGRVCGQFTLTLFIEVGRSARCGWHHSLRYWRRGKMELSTSTPHSLLLGCVSYVTWCLKRLLLYFCHRGL